MIIKSYARKAPSFAQLINYIAEERLHSKEPIRFFQCLPSQNLEQIIHAFQENDRYRVPRKNGTACYHSILSFHTLDSPLVTPEILYDLMRHYAQLRAPHSPCFAQSHHDKEHVHIHVLLAGNEYRSAKATRQSRREFYQLRAQLELYQEKKYPQLQQSLVYGRMREFPKQELQSVLLDAYEKAACQNQFFQMVQQEFSTKITIDQENKLLSYQGKTYHFSDFGLDLSIFKRIEQLQQIEDALILTKERER